MPLSKSQKKTYYQSLSKELQQLCKSAPLQWGQIQNNKTDNLIDMFSCKNVDDLEFKIKNLKSETQNYYRRRWFIWKCSMVDEYLFTQLASVKSNPIKKDKNWDIAFSDKYKFDLKGTVVPKMMRSNFDINLEEELISFYYKNQSKGVRFGEQNRLFTVHHSFKKQDRSIYLRCHWELKEKAYSTFNLLLKENKINWISYKNAISKCIFILESKDNEFYFKII